MFCSSCGLNLSPTAVFCPRCGTKIGSDSTPPPIHRPESHAAAVPAPVIPAPVASKSKAWIGWLIGGSLSVLVILIICLGLFTNIFKSDETLIRERLEEFVSCYCEGDLAGVVECFDKSTQNSVNSQIGFGESIFKKNTDYDISYAAMFSTSMALNDGEMLEIVDVPSIVFTDSTHAVATVKIQSTVSFFGSTRQMEDTAKFHMVKQDGDWYITDAK